MIHKEHVAVISGIGIVSPLANNKNDFLYKLQKGTPATCEQVDFNIPGFPATNVFPVKESHAFQHAVSLDPVIRFGLSAASQALEDSKLEVSTIDPYSMGVVISSSKGGVVSFPRYAEQLRVRPSMLNGHKLYASIMPSSVRRWVAKEYDIRGPVKSVVTACATGTHSIIEAVRMVEAGEVTYCLAGASDASITPLMIAGYRNMGVYGSNEMCPFDQRRDGFIIGEGAGVVLIERKESALKRNAPIYAEVYDCIMGQEMGNGINFKPLKATLAELLKRLDARSGGEFINYINMHGTATPIGDVYETSQIKHAFGKRAYDMQLSSTKSFMGHLLGAAGAVEVIVTALSIVYDFIPPTVNFRIPDPLCDLRFTPNIALSRTVDRALSISIGFGGQVGVIALRKKSL